MYLQPSRHSYYFVGERFDFELLTCNEKMNKCSKISLKYIYISSQGLGIQDTF